MVEQKVCQVQSCSGGNSFSELSWDRVLVFFVPNVLQWKSRGACGGIVVAFYCGIVAAIGWFLLAELLVTHSSSCGAVVAVRFLLWSAGIQSWSSSRRVLKRR